MKSIIKNNQRLQGPLRGKKGVSAVVGVVIMVALVIGLTAVVWVVISNVVEDELGSTSSCLDRDKVTLNNRYTCLNASTNELTFFVKVSEINVSEIIISVLGSGEAKSFRIDNTKNYSYLKPLTGSYWDVLILPEADSGKSYQLNVTDIGLGSVDAIEIIPVIDGDPCDASDSIQSIDNCQVYID